MSALKFKFGFTVAFSGHRPPKVGGYDEENETASRLKALLLKTVGFLYERGAREFVTGAALGIDTWAAEAVLEFRKGHPDVKPHVYLPCKGWGSNWPYEASRKRLKDITSRSIVTYVTKETFDFSCLEKRNQAMIDAADLLVAVWDGTRGGTKNAVVYAEKTGKPVILLPVNPKTQLELGL